MKSYLFPGQGSQRVGMGENLFDAFPDITATADAILDYSIKELCLRDPDRQLGQTQYTQPALYVVNALNHRQRARDTGERPDFVAGHSVGEYNALECAGVVSFEDGLRLVQRRGQLMSTAPKGAMAAVIGLTAERVGEILAENGLSAIDVANYNAHNQTIISGLEADIRDAQPCFERHQGMYIPLNVSGAFHSRYMAPVQADFADFLDTIKFSDPRIPVIANVDARPYQPGQVARTLRDQLTHSVRWLDSIRYLLDQGVQEFIESGPGDVLTKLVRSIRSQYKPAPATASAIAPAITPPPAAVRRNGGAEDAQQTVAAWNRSFPVGSRVRVKGYDDALITKTEAVVLFGHRAAVYMQGYNGYFALDDVEPAAS
ncbi:MAG TPA: ACP S-malonyltransferase [Azospirillum sp.]